MVRPAHIPLPKTRPRQFSADRPGTYAYCYDSAYRLTSESRSGFRSYSASHTYDAMGNRLTRNLDGVTRSYSYNDADQVVSWAEGTKVGSYTYDIEGSVTQKVVTDGGTPTDQWDYEFDSVGRMDNGQQSVVASPKSTSNVYAGDQWHRVQSTTGTAASPVTMKYGWRRDELLAEFDGSNLTAGYLNDGVDRPLYKTRFSSDGSVVDGRDFYHGDANLRVHHVSDASGNLTEKYVYNAYGRRTILDASNNPLSSSGIGNRIGFQGREHEDVGSEGQEAGLTFHRNRFYDPDVGRWGRRDPIGYDGGLNLYEYVDSRFSLSVDPFGNAALNIKPGKIRFGRCGFVSWRSIWKIVPRAEESGYVIQEVKLTGRIENCSGWPLPTKLDFHYGEAWQVFKGASFPLDGGDTFRNKNYGSCTKGWVKWEGKAGWHPGEKRPSKWPPGGQAHPAGLLPRFDIGKPPWSSEYKPYDETLNTVRHELEIRWDCCNFPYKSPTEIVSHDP